jgi:hypothetical protein
MRMVVGVTNVAGCRGRQATQPGLRQPDARSCGTHGAGRASEASQRALGAVQPPATRGAAEPTKPVRHMAASGWGCRRALLAS